MTVKLNMELACEPAVIDIACSVRPDQATLVPERRQEVTTEGGLDVVANQAQVAQAVERLRKAGIYVSLFLDPDLEQIETGSLGSGGSGTAYRRLRVVQRRRGAEQLVKLVNAARRVRALDLGLHAGHGLNYQNVRPVATIAGMRELNIGHSIISRAMLIGLERAVRNMKELLDRSAD